MGLRYAKDAATLKNVLKVVETLLIIADAEITASADSVLFTLADHRQITIPKDKLTTIPKAEWTKDPLTKEFQILQISGNKKVQTDKEGITLNDLCTLVAYIIGEPLQSYGKKAKSIVQLVFDCLRDLYDDKDKTKITNDGQGYWQLKLKLKHQTAEKKDNLQVIRDLWAAKIGGVTDSQPATPAEKAPNLREICQNLLDEEAQRHQATGRYMGHEVNIYVPLGLVKPKQQPRRSGEDADPKQGSQQYQPQGEKEIQERYAHQDFLDRVIAKADKNLAIIGEPGAGKTTWLQQIVRYLTSTSLTKGGRGNSVIWIPLANLGELTLEEYLLSRWLKDAFSVSEATAAQKKALEDLFNTGKVWLLLDGVDEMTSANPLTQISQSLTGWVKQARVVLTCRLNVWEANPNALPKFDTYRTLCFEGEQVNDFISQWFGKTLKPELGQELQGKLAEAESARIFDLVKNPLRLSLLCEAWCVNQGTLPTTQAKLYQRFCNGFYGWKQKQFPTSRSQREELNKRLRQLAFRATAEKIPLGEELVYEVLSEEWFELAEKLGWLNLVYLDIDTDEPIYAFFHLTFQEYFAALAVDDWSEFLPRTHVGYPLEGEEYRIFQPQWKQVILLWLGRGDIADDNKEEFIQALVNLNDGCGKWNLEEVNRGFYEYRAYFLAAAGISEFKTCSLGDVIVKQIVQWEFDENQEKQEWQDFLDPINESARVSLPQTDRKRAIQELCQILKQPQCDELTRMQAAFTLVNIDPGNETAIAALVKLFETTDNEYTRREVASSLEKIDPGNETAIAALVKLFETTNNEYTRREVASSLGEIGQGNQTAIAALVKLFETTDNKYTRREVAFSLQKIGQGNQTAIAALVKVLETTKYEWTRREAVEILGTIGLGNQTAIAALVKVLETTKYKWTRIRAASSLGKIGLGNQTAIAAFVKLLETTEDKLTRWQVASDLGKIGLGNQTAIAAFVKLLETTEYEDTRREAVESLEKVGQGNETAIAALVKVLETTEDEDTRREAAKSLGEIGLGNQTAIAALVTLLETTEYEWTRWEAVEILGKIGLGNQTAISALVTLLETTEDEDTRWEAASTLGKIDPGNQTAISALVKTTENEHTGWEAASTLGKIDPGNKTAISALVKTTENEDTRWEVASTLGKIDPGNQTSISALVRILETTENKFTRREAVESLEKIGLGNQTAIAALVRVLESTEYEDIHWEAAKSLGKIGLGNQTAIAALVRVLEITEDESTRWLTASSLGKIITTDEQRKTLVTALQPHLNDETYENNFELYENCYEVLWNIAQDLPYPDFYRAWHGSTKTSPFGAKNLAQLPQSLQAQLTETNLNQTLQLFCIDGSQFIGDDPAKRIYRQMTQQGSPKIDDKPKNMADLQDYWDDLIDENDKTPVLIFYQDPSKQNSQGFNPTFLDMLTRFNGIICLITDQTHPGLQTFSPQDPQLIDNIIAWLERTILEM